jgi:hypothetical protein
MKVVEDCGNMAFCLAFEFEFEFEFESEIGLGDRKEQMLEFALEWGLAVDRFLDFCCVDELLPKFSFVYDHVILLFLVFLSFQSKAGPHP